jgi:hypothetical protein
VLKLISQTTDPDALQALARTIEALAPRLTDAQATQALDPILKQIGQTNNPFVFQVIAEAIKALAPKLTDTQAAQALDPILKQMGRTTDAATVRALAGATKTLASGLTDAQAAQALDPILKQIGQTTDASALEALAKATEALAPRLKLEQARKASVQAMAGLAWAAGEREAAVWAGTLASLLDSAPDPDRTRVLATAVAYPAAAGAATEVLLDALWAASNQVPAKDKGTQAALVSLAKLYPDLLHPPACPEPPQPYELSGLRCPSVGASSPQ